MNADIRIYIYALTIEPHKVCGNRYYIARFYYYRFMITNYIATLVFTERHVYGEICPYA